MSLLQKSRHGWKGYKYGRRVPSSIRVNFRPPGQDMEGKEFNLYIIIFRIGVCIH